MTTPRDAILAFLTHAGNEEGSDPVEVHTESAKVTATNASDCGINNTRLTDQS